MAWSAQALPVIPLPELNHVSMMRHDVVEISRYRYQPLLLAMDAQWVLGKVSRSRLLPSITVTLGSAAANLFWIMLFY
jgi:hypothetical protein